MTQKVQNNKKKPSGVWLQKVAIRTDRGSRISRQKCKTKNILVSDMYTKAHTRRMLEGEDTEYIDNLGESQREGTLGKGNNNGGKI